MDHEQKCIKEFMLAGNQTVREKPTTDVSSQEKMLRIKLMTSELSELIDALDFIEDWFNVDAVSDSCPFYDVYEVGNSVCNVCEVIFC